MPLPRWFKRYCLNRGRGESVPPAPLDPPVAAFSGTPLSGEGPLAVVFTDASTGIISDRLWEKDDGSGWIDFEGNANDQNPTEQFAEGVWDIRLTVSNSGGSDGETKPDYVTATAPVAFDPSLDFSDSRNSMYYGSLV